MQCRCVFYRACVVVVVFVLCIVKTHLCKCVRSADDMHISEWLVFPTLTSLIRSTRQPCAMPGRVHAALFCFSVAAKIASSQLLAANNCNSKLAKPILTSKVN